MPGPTQHPARQKFCTSHPVVRIAVLQPVLNSYASRKNRRSNRMSDRNAQTKPTSEATFEQALVVSVCVPEFGIAYATASDGNRYALTERTLGLDVTRLAVGDTVSCIITERLPRVISARLDRRAQ